MEFTRDQIKEATKNLPETIKEFIYSDRFTLALTEIGKKNQLLLDKMGPLEDEIFLVACGLKSSTSFVESIGRRLGLDRATAEGVAAEVNANIFLKMREQIGAPSPEEKKEGPALAEDSTTGLSRGEILSEIENPTPVVHPISAADQTVPGPATPREVIPEPAKDPVSKEFVAGKLAEPVNMPTQKSYAADPYREPIN